MRHCSISLTAWQRAGLQQPRQAGRVDRRGGNGVSAQNSPTAREYEQSRSIVSPSGGVVSGFLSFVRRPPPPDTSQERSDP